MIQRFFSGMGAFGRGWRFAFSRGGLTAWPSHVRRDLHFYPRLVIDAGRETARALAGELAAGAPPIVVPHAPLDRGELVIAPEAIAAKDRRIVEGALGELAARVAVGAAAGDGAR